MGLRIGSIIIRIFLALLAIYIVLIPLALVIVLMNYGGSINEDILVKSLSDMLCEGNLMYINIIAVLICSILNMMGIYSELQYRMNALPSFTMTSIVTCVMGILFVICFVKVKLVLFSFILRNNLGMKKKPLISAISAAVTVTGFLLSNLLAYWINGRQVPLFWALTVCFICLIFIFAQNQAVKMTIVGEDGYFGSLSRLGLEVLSGIQGAVSSTLLVFFLYYMGTMYTDITDLGQIVLLAICSYGGAYLAMESLGDDNSKLQKYGSFAVALVLFTVMVGSVS